jgi:hypothetical protein
VVTVGIETQLLFWARNRTGVTAALLVWSYIPPGIRAILYDILRSEILSIMKRNSFLSTVLIALSRDVVVNLESPLQVSLGTP